MFSHWTGNTETDIWLTPKFAGTEVSAGYSFRLGGHSEPPYDSLNLGLHVGDDPEQVVRNRQVVANRGFGDVSTWALVNQVHGSDVAVIGARGTGMSLSELPVSEADGMITNEPDTTLVILTADCVPVLFYDPVQKAIGAAHSGWRGTTLHVVQQVILHMNFLYGTLAEDLHVSIGPSIRQCCYEVDEKVAEPVFEQFGEQYLTRRFGKPGKYLLSLQACIHSDLTKMGVRAENIEDVGVCTACHTDVLFSHRAEHGRTGREAGLIRLHAPS